MAASKATPSRGPVHTVMATHPDNMQAMVAWYTAALGMRTVHRTKQGHMQFLTYDGEHHRIGLIAMPGTKPRAPGTAGVAHVAYTYDSLRALAEGFAARKAAGILPVWSVHHGPTISSYYKDPDGNTLEMQWDAMLPDEATAFLDGPLYAENPFGADVDPATILERLNSGESEEAFRVREEVGPRDFDTVPKAMVE